MKSITCIIGISMLLAVGIVGMGAEYVINVAFVSGHLHTGYSNTCYTDTVEIVSAEANFSATYNAQDLTRSWNMNDSFFWPTGGSSGAANPGPADYINTNAVGNATGYYANQYQQFQTSHAGSYSANGKVCGDATVDFAAGTAAINNKGHAGGYWYMSQEVGVDADGNGNTFPAGDYYNNVTGGPVSDNDGNALHTRATFGGNTLIYGNRPNRWPSMAGCAGNTGGPTPANIGLYLFNPTGMDVDGQLGGTWSETTLSYSGGIPIKSDSVVNPGPPAGLQIFGFSGTYSGHRGQLFGVSIDN